MDTPTVPKKRGRPSGSKNKPKSEEVKTSKGSKTTSDEPVVKQDRANRLKTPKPSRSAPSPGTNTPLPPILAPDAATFNDDIDYPINAPAGLARPVAISMLRGSVNTFTERHAFTQILDGHGAGQSLEGFLGDVYRFARSKGFNKGEAEEVRKGLMAKYGSSTQRQEEEKSTEAVGINGAVEEHASVGNNLTTPATVARAKSVDSVLGPDTPDIDAEADVTATVSRKKRKRASGIDGETVPAKKVKKSKSLTAHAQDDSRPQGRRKTPKKSPLADAVTHSPTPEVELAEDVGRRSRSTSLGELGPEQPTAQPASTAKRAPDMLVNGDRLEQDEVVAVDGERVEDDDSDVVRDQSPESAVKIDFDDEEAEDEVIDSDVSQEDDAVNDDEERPTFAVDMDEEEERPTFTVDVDDEEEEATQIDLDDEEGEQVTFSTADEEEEQPSFEIDNDDGQERVPSSEDDASEGAEILAFEDAASDDEVEDQDEDRLALAAEPAAHDAEAISEPPDAQQQSLAVATPKTPSQTVPDGSYMIDDPNSMTNSFQRTASLLSTSFNSNESSKKKKRRKSGKRKRDSSPAMPASDNAAAGSSKAVAQEDEVHAMQSLKPRKIARFTIGGADPVSIASSQAPAPDPAQVDENMPAASKQELKSWKQARKAEKKAQKAARRAVARAARRGETAGLQAGELPHVVLPRAEEGSPDQLEEMDEPMPKDLERVFMTLSETAPEQPARSSFGRASYKLVETRPERPISPSFECTSFTLTETVPASPPCKEYFDMAVQTSPSLLLRSTPPPNRPSAPNEISSSAPAMVTSQDSSRSRPSQQPSPTESESSASLDTVAFQKRTPAQTYSKKNVASSRRTPATSFIEAEAPGSSTVTASGKLKRITRTRPAQRTRHTVTRSADLSIAETASIASPNKFVAPEVIETLEEDERPSSPELGVRPPQRKALNGRHFPPQSMDDAEDASVIVEDDEVINISDADEEEPQAHVKDSQQVVPESYAHFTVINRAQEKSQMARGLFDRTQRVPSTHSEPEEEEEESDNETDDDIPHHIRGKTPVRQPMANNESETESEPEVETIEPPTAGATLSAASMRSPSTDDMQDLVNSQLQDEIVYEASQRRSQQISTPPPQPRKRKEMATTIAKRTNAPSPRKKTGTASEHFAASPGVKTPKTPLTKEVKEPKSGLPFPSTDEDTFGLFQERFAFEPFKLLVAVMFVNQTPGTRAIPVVERLFDRFPKISDFADAEVHELEIMIQHLGLGSQRAERLVKMAKVWEANPPVVGKRYKSKDRHYPTNDENKASKEKILNEDFEYCGAHIEIAHLPGCGAYAYDSWRIFCRDMLRGVADGWNGEGVDERSTEEGAFQPEWMRVNPKDKELRAFIRWMWLKEGFAWDWHTGEKVVADAKLLAVARETPNLVELRMSRKFKGSRKSDSFRDTSSIGTSRGQSVATSRGPSVATSRGPGTIRKTVSRDLEDDRIEDDEMLDAPEEEEDVDEGPSETMDPPSTPPGRRLGARGRPNAPRAEKRTRM